ncbi:MAG: hypothetical protein WCT41_02845 [Candidatus Paceibacterota bacterium]|jgi:hypothetical protein
MSRASTLILLGVLVILAPFSGFPVAIRSLFAVIFGACVLGIGLSMRAREARHTMESVSSEARTMQPPQSPSSV